MTYPLNRFCSVVCDCEWPEIDENAIAVKPCELLIHLLRRMKKKSKWPTNQDGGLWPLYFAKVFVLRLRIVSIGPDLVHRLIFIWLDHCTMYLWNSTEIQNGRLFKMADFHISEIWKLFQSIVMWLKWYFSVQKDFWDVCVFDIAVLLLHN